MAETLTDILTPRSEEETLRWEVAVPLGTNPFILLELLQFSLVGAALLLVCLTFGLYLTEGAVDPGGILAIMHFCGLLVLGVFVLFFVIAFVFFGNRYYTVYLLDAGGIFYEGIRGNDGRAGGFLFRLRPYPVQGRIRAARSRSRHLIWEKTDRFYDIPGMRVVFLKRGIWHMLKLYSPDQETHAALVGYLNRRFSAKGAFPV